MSARRAPSYRIQRSDVPLIKKLLKSGEFQNRIAARFDVNSARISEIKTGKKFSEVPAAE